MIYEYSSWLTNGVAMLRTSHDCLCFEGCERHGVLVSFDPRIGDNEIEICYTVPRQFLISRTVDP